MGIEKAQHKNKIGGNVLFRFFPTLSSPLSHSESLEQATTNQKHCQDLGGDKSLVWNLWASFRQMSFYRENPEMSGVVGPVVDLLWVCKC